MAKTASGLAAISVDCWPLIAMGAERSKAGPQLPSGAWIVMSRQAEPARFRGRRAGDPRRPHGRRGESPRPRRSATSAREPVSSPRRHNGRRETYVVDHRPSDLDPYPRFGRDLATLELWEQSLARSRQRRRLEQASRSHRQRRKGTSLALGAAMLAAPVMPAFAGGSSRGSGASGGRSGAADSGVDVSSLAAATGGRTQLLRFGDVGPAVVAIQRQVGVAPDGMFGPITRAAVERFQRVHGLGVSGIVDARTWAALFNGRVLFYDESGGRGAAPSAPSRASLRLVVDRDSDGAGSSTASPEGTGRVARA